MSDIKHDKDFSNQELVQPEETEGEKQLKATSDFEHVNLNEDFDYVDTSMENLESLENREASLRHRTKEESLKLYLQDKKIREAKGHH